MGSEYSSRRKLNDDNKILFSKEIYTLKMGIWSYHCDDYKDHTITEFDTV